MALRPRREPVRQPLCADIDSFGLYAAVRSEAQARTRLEQLRRHITRPAPSDEQVQCIAAGQAELELKTPWHDRTNHQVITLLEFMHRLAAQALMRCGLTLNRARDTGASDRFLPTNPERRVSPMGRLPAHTNDC